MYNILFCGILALLTELMVCVCVRSQLRLLSSCSTVRSTGVEIHCSQASLPPPTHSKTRRLVCYCESAEPYVHINKGNELICLYCTYHLYLFYYYYHYFLNSFHCYTHSLTTPSVTGLLSSCLIRP